VTEHAVGFEAPARTQVVELKLPDPRVLLNVTVPVGGVGLPLVSVTVAVQIELCP